MSPTPARTSRDAITAAAREILEEDGMGAVTMQAVAARVGVRAPSLYKHVADRETLIRAVRTTIIEDLATAILPDVASTDARGTLRVVARRYRTFVHLNPIGYGSLFQPDGRLTEADTALLASLGRPLVEVMRELVGAAAALGAARTFVAWAHGFTSLELVGGFRLGGDLDRAYEDGIELILAGVSGSDHPQAG